MFVLPLTEPPLETIYIGLSRIHDLLYKCRVASLQSLNQFRQNIQAKVNSFLFSPFPKELLPTDAYPQRVFFLFAWTFCRLCKFSNTSKSGLGRGFSNILTKKAITREEKIILLWSLLGEELNHLFFLAFPFFSKVSQIVLIFVGTSVSTSTSIVFLVQTWTIWRLGITKSTTWGQNLTSRRTRTSLASWVNYRKSGSRRSLESHGMTAFFHSD